MRITHESLLKVSRETTELRVHQDRTIVAVYLCGSLLQEAYMLGGAADIDLVFVHTETPALEREISPLTNEVHLDIAHHVQRDYRQGKQLRLHPWLGPTLNGCRVLYDTQHFMDFVQASVRGQFDRPDYIYARVQNQFDQARALWSDLHPQRIGHDYHPMRRGEAAQNDGQQEPATQGAGAHAQARILQGYLRSLGLAANAVASLSGPPLPERRLLLQFRQRAEAAAKPGLYPGLLGLLGSPNIRGEAYPHLIELWEQVFYALPEEKVPPRLHPARHDYYSRAFAEFLAENQAEAVLWPLLHTLSKALVFLEAETEAQQAATEILAVLGLQGEHLQERILALDSYLDLVEETLEQWAQANGV